jgi:hypothetical protein
VVCVICLHISKCAVGSVFAKDCFMLAGAGRGITPTLAVVFDGRVCQTGRNPITACLCHIPCLGEAISLYSLSLQRYMQYRQHRQHGVEGTALQAAHCVGPSTLQLPQMLPDIGSWAVPSHCRSGGCGGNPSSCCLVTVYLTSVQQCHTCCICVCLVDPPAPCPTVSLAPPALPFTKHCLPCGGLCCSYH